MLGLTADRRGFSGYAESGNLPISTKARTSQKANYWDILPPYTDQQTRFLMAMSTVFTNNRTQAVRLPAEVRLPEGVKRVSVRAIGNERIIAPLENTWDSFFMNGPQASNDFMPERASQHQDKREALE
jgi:antitoxin VapB